jgi:hypothetical protein
VTGLERAWFDKSTAISLQFSFTRLAEQAGLVDVVKGTNPQQLDLSVHQTAAHDRIVEYGMRLLFDAGCRVFHSNLAGRRAIMPVGDDSSTEADDTSPMQIGIIATPVGRQRTGAVLRRPLGEGLSSKRRFCGDGRLGGALGDQPQRQRYVACEAGRACLR